jgi:hypothetical protein
MENKQCERDRENVNLSSYTKVVLGSGDDLVITDDENITLNLLRNAMHLVVLPVTSNYNLSTTGQACMHSSNNKSNNRRSGLADNKNLASMTGSGARKDADSCFTNTISLYTKNSLSIYN